SSWLWATRSTILDSDPDRRSSLELSGNGIFPDEVFMCLFSTKRKCKVHLDWRSIGMNFRLYLEHLCQSEPAMPCKIFSAHESNGMTRKGMNSFSCISCRS